MLTILFEIILFAMAMTFLMAWGYVKKQRQSEELVGDLMQNCEKKVRKAFKKNDFLSYVELSEMIKGTKASLFWSKKKAVVNDPTGILDTILTEMMSKGLITEGKQKTYRWVQGGDL
ncbi:hypothetical protein [Fusibacter sp. 3D3]|uniref:hypothetical protein n=1 Tax=Fusibacter sp. 3D3 TaxID=1048380 RepID=UPI000853B3FA|nr:hypothetical protein [Fusibacter sp. 3D3]GAU76787.1 hypothetical protein F3D3_1385 [Fusibacter sp. 3D3]